MIAFKVSRNGKRLVLAGADDLGVLDVSLSALGPLGATSCSFSSFRRTPLIHLQVSGLTSRPKGVADEHLQWIPLLGLAAGDRITILVTEVPSADPIVGSTPAAQKTPLADEFEAFKLLEKRYLALKKKFGTKTNKRASKPTRCRRRPPPREL